MLNKKSTCHIHMKQQNFFLISLDFILKKKMKKHEQVY